MSYRLHPPSGSSETWSELGSGKFSLVITLKVAKKVQFVREDAHKKCFFLVVGPPREGNPLNHQKKRKKDSIS